MKYIVIIILSLLSFNSIGMTERTNYTHSIEYKQLKEQSKVIAPKKTKRVKQLSNGEKLSYYIQIGVGIFCIILLVLVI